MAVEIAVAGGPLTPSIPLARTDWLDYAKGMGILLVVYGHLLSSNFNARVPVPGQFFALSDSIVYSFHIPLFFFLAGLVVAGSYRKRGANAFMKDKLAHLARPYLIWCGLQVLVELLFSRHVNRPVTWLDLAEIPILPHEQFWFLYALFWAYLCYALCRFLSLPLVIFAVAAVVLFSFPIHTEYGALDKFSIEIPFFVLGTLVAQPLMELVRRRVPTLAILIPVSVFFAGCEYAEFAGITSAQRLELDYGTHGLAFLALALLGTMTVIGWAAYLADRRSWSWLATLGRYSLPIYVTHMLLGVPVRMALLQVLHTQNWLLHIVAGMLVALVAPVLLFKLVEHTRLRFVF